VVDSCLLCPWGCWWPQKLWSAGTRNSISTQVLLKIITAWHHRANETLPCVLVHTMLFVGSIWKNKSGWSLFVMSLVLCWWPQKLCW
jgi:hypothetical protein